MMGLFVPAAMWTRVGPVVITPVDAQQGVFSSGQYNFASVNFGPAKSGRVIVACVADRTGSALSQVQFNGTNGNQRATEVNSANGMNAEIWDYGVPSGTSGAIKVYSSNGSASNGVTLMVFALTGGLSGTPAYATQNTASAAVTTSVSAAITAAAKSATLASVCKNVSAYDVSFSSPAGMTTYDNLYMSTGGDGLGAAGYTTASGSLTVTANTASASGRWVMAVANWQ